MPLFSGTAKDEKGFALSRATYFQGNDNHSNFQGNDNHSKQAASLSS
jgi:hypothetical protein